jgi:hypothetical protein
MFTWFHQTSVNKRQAGWACFACVIVAGRPKVRKKINCTYVDDIDTHMLEHGMDARGLWQEPVAGVVNSKKKVFINLFI